MRNSFLILSCVIVSIVALVMGFAFGISAGNNLKNVEAKAPVNTATANTPANCSQQVQTAQVLTTNGVFKGTAWRIDIPNSYGLAVFITNYHVADNDGKGEYLKEYEPGNLHDQLILEHNVKLIHVNVLGGVFTHNSQINKDIAVLTVAENQADWLGLKPVQLAEAQAVKSMARHSNMVFGFPRGIKASSKTSYYAQIDSTTSAPVNLELYNTQKPIIYGGMSGGLLLSCLRGKPVAVGMVNGSAYSPQEPAAYSPNSNNIATGPSAVGRIERLGAQALVHGSAVPANIIKNYVQSRWVWQKAPPPLPPKRPNNGK